MKGRTYRFMSDPLFSFGFGLSYTTFSIGKGQLSKSKVNKNESVILTVPVTNTGKRNGVEVVQVYIRKTGDNTGPLKTLRGFKKITVDAGKKASAAIELPYSAFAFYNEATEKQELTVMPGAYEILYGPSSLEKDLQVLKIAVQ